MLMGAPGEEVYISRMRAEELREKAENDYTCRMMRKEIERLDRLIYAKNKILKDEQERIPIEEWSTLGINLSVRAFTALKKANVQTFGQLLAMTYGDLKRIRNMGQKTADEVAEEVGRAGFTLTEEDE
jgi:DNA-directed RNA polymerase subunit alpha